MNKKKFFLNFELKKTLSVVLIVTKRAIRLYRSVTIGDGRFKASLCIRKLLATKYNTMKNVLLSFGSVQILNYFGYFYFLFFLRLFLRFELKWLVLIPVPSVLGIPLRIKSCVANTKLKKLYSKLESTFSMWNIC